MYFWNTLYLWVACTGDIQKVTPSLCESQNSQEPAPRQAIKHVHISWLLSTYKYVYMYTLYKYIDIQANVYYVHIV